MTTTTEKGCPTCKSREASVIQWSVFECWNCGKPYSPPFVFLIIDGEIVRGYVERRSPGVFEGTVTVTVNVGDRALLKDETELYETEEEAREWVVRFERIAQLVNSDRRSPLSMLVDATANKQNL